jgi:hypothetical protein
VDHIERDCPLGSSGRGSLIDQIVYITDFDADLLVPPCEHYDIVSDNFYDSNSGNVPSKIDNFCCDNHDNGSGYVSNDIDTVCDGIFVDGMSSDTISRVVHTNTYHDNVDNATIRSGIVSTINCDNFTDYGDNIIDSGIVYTNIDCTACDNVNDIVVSSGVVNTNTTHMSYDNVDIVPTSSRIVYIY